MFVDLVVERTGQTACAFDVLAGTTVHARLVRRTVVVGQACAEGVGFVEGRQVVRVARCIDQLITVVQLAVGIGVVGQDAEVAEQRLLVAEFRALVLAAGVEWRRDQVHGIGVALAVEVGGADGAVRHDRFQVHVEQAHREGRLRREVPFGADFGVIRLDRVQVDVAAAAAQCIVVQRNRAAQRAVVRTGDGAGDGAADDQVVAHIELDVGARQEVVVAALVQFLRVRTPVGTGDRAAGLVDQGRLLGMHGAQAEVTAPGIARQVGHGVDRRGFFLQLEFVRPVVATHVVEQAVARCRAPGAQCRTVVLEVIARQVAAQVIGEVARVHRAIPDRTRIGEAQVARTGFERMLGNALVVGHAATELDRIPDAGRQAQLCVELGIFFLVDGARFAATGPGRRAWLVGGAARIRHGCRAHAVQLIHHAAIDVVLVVDIVAVIAHAMGLAQLAGQGQVLGGAVFEVEIEVVRFAAGVRTVDIVDFARVGGERGARQGTVLDRVVGRHLVGAVDRVRWRGQPVGVLMRRLQLRIEAVHIQRQVLAWLEFDVECAAFAGFLLLEQAGADKGRHFHAGQFRVRQRCRAVGQDRRVAQDFLAIAAHGRFLREALHHDAQGVRVILPVHQAGELWIGLAGQVIVECLDRTFGRDLVLEFQRTAGDHVDHARHAAFRQVGGGALVHDNRADQFRWQQGEAAAAADVAAKLVQHEPVAGADGMAIEQGLLEAWAGAAQADAVVFAEAAFATGRGLGIHTWQALDRVSHVTVWHFADVFGRHHFHHGIRIAFLLQRFFQRCAHAGHRDGRHIFGGCFLRLRRKSQTSNHHGNGRGDRRTVTRSGFQYGSCRCQIAFHVLPLDLDPRIGTFSFLM